MGVGGAIGLPASALMPKAGIGTHSFGLLLSIVKGADLGWSSPLTRGLLAGVLVILVLQWGLFELRSASPLADLPVPAKPVWRLPPAAW